MTIQRVFAWLAKSFARVFLFMAVALALLFTLLWFEHKTPITLPALTGRFTVGRTTRAWVNNEASDELAPSPGAKREVVVWIWYPSAAVPAAPPA
jgi:hypothetical protein